MNRRFFLKAALGSVIPGLAGGAAYGLFESGWVQVTRPTIVLPHLPKAFDGTTVALLTDIHHGPFTSLDYVNAIVRTTLTLRPDLIVLGGDYSLKEGKYIRPCFDAMAALNAPLGVYGVLGNHDYWHGLEETREGFRTAGIGELTNRGVWLERDGSRFRLAGVDDLWMGKVDVKAALGDATPEDACLLLSHNPDVAEKMRDPRVGLMLSGHTHGGQVVFPTGDAPFVPSHYGTKYLKGLVQAPNTKVYISRGLGTTSAPFRVGSRPELTLITLHSA
ncbi:metallophosphoesterase [Gemmata sp. G18]|uniref:Metallophosphoesterase n=1 Tax=Gemmata palustris TaxID=2822762 RepID=A0ABS5BYR6_9BACT|nr:metallophosphoesterase [Gemmata palustris]MBP3958788.1 metallophosphoesterase [Gemmata palustris]